MKKNYPSHLLMSLSFFVGMATMIPFAILENLEVFGNVNYDISNLGPTPILGLAYMIIFSSIVAYYAFEWVINKVSVTDAGLFGYLHPFLTIPFAYILLRELPDKFNVLGGAIIALGVIIAETFAHKTPGERHKVN